MCMFHQVMAAIGLVTVKSCTRELDPKRKWIIRYETQMVKGKDMPSAADNHRRAPVGCVQRVR